MTRPERTLSRRALLQVAAGLSALAATRDAAYARQAESGRMLTIAAKPEPVAIDASRAAVVVVDMQNDFAAEGGMFHRAGIDISMIRAAIAPTARALAAARNEAIPIVYLKMAFKPDLSDAGPEDSPLLARGLKTFRFGERVKSPAGVDGRILIRDTWNTDILPELQPQAQDIVLYKHRFSGFYETELDSILKRLGARHLIFTGCTTSLCVESTIRDARFRDYMPVLLADCTAEPLGHGFARSNHDASLFLIEKSFGWVSTSADFIQALATHSDTGASES